MTKLSIGDAWEKTAVLVQRENRLLLPVALLLVALPNAAFQLFFPFETMVAQLKAHHYPPWLPLIVLPFLVVVLGTLTLTALALVPRISVGEALTTAIRRFPVLVGARLILLVGFAVAAAAGAAALDANPAAGALLVLVLMPAALLVVVRMSLLEPVAVAQAIDPIAALKESWRLTAGNFWRLLGFLIVFAVGNLVLSMVAGMMTKLLAVVIDKAAAGAQIGDLISALLVGVVSAITTTVVAVMVAMIYRQCRPDAVGEVFS